MFRDRLVFLIGERGGFKRLHGMQTPTIYNMSICGMRVACDVLETHYDSYDRDSRKGSSSFVGKSKISAVELSQHHQD